ncbi:hypothetical protein, partial [Cohnella faecalis]|uniref:hypothetical protein n=1 Tax=Cohnella faecalis TaxID=2315694 RepID=UPI001F2EBCD0
HPTLTTAFRKSKTGPAQGPEKKPFLWLADQPAEVGYRKRNVCANKIIRFVDGFPAFVLV